MTDSDSGMRSAPAARRRAARRPWGVIAALAVVGASIYVAMFAAADRTAPNDARAAAVVLGPVELAGATGARAADFVRANPPVDIAAVERAASGATLGRVALPDSRQLVTYHDNATGADVTQGVIVYDDAAKAADLESFGAPLLGSSFGLESEAIAIDGTDSALRWRAPSYQAVTFRVGGTIGFVGTTDTRDPDGVVRLAEALRDRSRAAAATVASVTTPSP